VEVFKGVSVLSMSKFQSRPGDASNNVTPSWSHDKQLLFLKDQVKNRVSQGNLQTTQPDTTIDSGSESFADNETVFRDTRGFCVAGALATCFGTKKGKKAAEHIA
jgi:hypothetical protein